MPGALHQLVLAPRQQLLVDCIDTLQVKKYQIKQNELEPKPEEIMLRTTLARLLVIR
jgi:hypothetical protein